MANLTDAETEVRIANARPQSSALLTPEQYRHLTWQFDDGEGIHPHVAATEYGFPQIKRPGLEVHVPEPPEGIDALEAHQVVIFQSHRYKNGNLVWLRRRSYSAWRRDDLGEVREAARG